VRGITPIHVKKVRSNMDLGTPERFGLLVFCGLVGLFGGGVRAALRKDPNPSPVRDVLANAAASGFAAFVVAAATLDLWPMGRDYAVIAIAGVCGWAGAAILDAATAGATTSLGRLIGRLTGTDVEKKP
jgi:hypothetical protein